jgi:hypothetical protein
LARPLRIEDVDRDRTMDQRREHDGTAVSVARML